mmetsp:Transcript_9224/g.27488  ORF Transcript_9224/g.27488 Transcript_9224/m.27488 type:complete len:264 (-) Transcript_9224:342-1133(-)
MRAKSGNWASSFLCLSTVITSFAVIVPCSFWPLSLLFSMSSHVPSPLANASAQARLRPPKQVVTRSARPHDSMKVSSWIPLKKRRANLAVSLSPIRMIAAFVFPPYPSPSQKPAPSATTFFIAPHSSAPATSVTACTAKSLVLKSLHHLRPFSGFVHPIVASAKSPLATSLATLAPISTDMSTTGAPSDFFISSCSKSEMRMGFMSPSFSNSMPLMREQPMAPFANLPSIFGTMGARKLCGMTNTIIVAPSTQVATSGHATML